MRSLCPSRPVRLARLGLERLEARDVPSTVTLSVSYNLGRSITLSGTLTGAPNMHEQSVVIAGKAVGEAPINDAGAFQITLTATGLGNVTAQAADGLSNIATVTLTDEAPVITSFEAIEGPGHVWTLRGTMTYFRPFESMTILFGGSPVSIRGLTTEADGSGTFELAVLLNGQGSDNGTVSAQAISPWDTVSELACDYILQIGS